ncbi:hypothetical protein AB0L00_23345 [Actinoallomurus sp. NPDC052308]|uniref:hypothetical protein n=1 Tax=Actinoallomurus sp. NPDC052308 TaxID=3155530 RepID=UPI003449661F
MTRRRQVVSALPSALTVAVAGLAFHRVFGWRALLPVVAVAVLVPSVIVLLLAARRRPWPLWTSLLLAVGCFPPVVSATLFRAHAAFGFLPSAATLREMAGGLRDSWKVTLTTLLPVADRPDVLVLASAVVWLGALAAAETALRTRLVTAPIVPALGVLAVALLLGADGPGSNRVVASGVVALAALAAWARASARVPSLAIGAPALVGLALLAGAIGPNLPLVAHRAPYDPRRPHLRTAAGRTGGREPARRGLGMAAEPRDAAVHRAGGESGELAAGDSGPL